MMVSVCEPTNPKSLAVQPPLHSSSARGPELGFGRLALCLGHLQNSALGLWSLVLPEVGGGQLGGGTGLGQTAGPITCATRTSGVGVEPRTPVSRKEG